ncbi:Gfo/Idh/MocA family protein [Bacillus sp. JJ722]|uniref:Gfo/Idh/MocA family protein n=1 Tax=Bacillus sp. JJ722 TaxID=3122973 RepID=UPI002FFF98D3
MTTKRVAIIGAGQVAEKVHVSYYQTRKEIEIVAVVDLNKEKAKDFANRNNIERYYSDPKEMYEKEKPDMVSICTPNKFHYDNVMLALEYGCHVMCEKPPAISARDAWEMNVTAKKKNSILAYDFHHRYADDVRILKEKIDEGILGDVYVVKVQALRRCGIPGWGSFTNKDIQGGGPLIDLGIHMLDAAMYVLGYPKVKSVHAKQYQMIGRKKNEGVFGKWDPEKFEVEDSLFGFIEFENGGLIQLETSFALNMKETSIMNVEFFGDRAGATLFPTEIYTDEKGELVYLYKREVSDPNRHTKSMGAFVDKCLGESVMIADGEQGYQIQKLVEALYNSANKGNTIIL